jgi:predicted metal-binding membrane protein
MEKLPGSLEIAIWIVGACWALAILVYLIGASMEWILPIFIFGLLTGIAEWFLRRKSQ